MVEEMAFLTIALIIIFLMGSVGYITAVVTDVTLENYDGYLSPLVNFVQEGYNFQISVPIPILPDLDLDFVFNPFSWLGGTIQDFIGNQLIYFGLLPAFLIIPLIILITLYFIYFIVKLIQGFIP